MKLIDDNNGTREYFFNNKGHELCVVVGYDISETLSSIDFLTDDDWVLTNLGLKWLLFVGAKIKHVLEIEQKYQSKFIFKAFGDVAEKKRESVYRSLISRFKISSFFNFEACMDYKKGLL